MAVVYLASQSPRRAELLRQIGVRFTVVEAADAPAEVRDPAETAADYVLRIARAKAAAGLATVRAQDLPLRPVLGADTEVIVDGDVLGKPADAAQAAHFLRLLSGRWHEVRSAVALATPNGTASAVSVSAVRFAHLSDEKIACYCATAEPYDKAGGYAIQGLAAVFIEELQGSFSGVMGLPLAETARLIEAAGMRVL
ncbi:MAG: Maf family protein [Betaproteobacteria bacterium]